MAEAKKENKTWKEIYREKVNQIREWSVKPDNWFVRLAPYILVAILSALITRLWWYKLTYPGRCLDIDDIFVEGIEGSLVINILLIIGCLYSTVLLLLYTYFNKPRYWHLPIYAITAVFICVIPKWHPVETAIPGLYYSGFIAICLVSILLGELLSLILGYITRDKLITLGSGEHGFVTKTEEKEMVDTGWEDYINTIFDLVGEKQLAEESFAIGIAGSWGSGKTTFYNAIKSKIKDDHRFVLCEFKPWQILEPGRIAPEFFAILAEALQNSEDGKHTHLLDDLKKYAQLLTEVPELPDYAKLFTSIVGANENKSVSAMRDQIDKHLKNSYIIVLIDDLDRLNKEELLEIMRLVRASANFKHVLFILTYDKGYFKRLLDDENGLEYLKKIVNVEISLPPIEQYKYGQLLYSSLQSMFNENIVELQEDKESISAMLKALDYIISRENSLAEESLLYEKLSNFRDIKRFANQFGLILRHIVELKYQDRYNISDLFWLELLHYTDEELYNNIKNNYQTFLSANVTSKNNEILTLKSEYLVDGKYKLLKSIFSTKGESSENSIVWLTNYYSYFALRQLDNYVSTTEFKILMSIDNRENASAKVIEWLSDEKKQKSVFQLLKDYPFYLKFDSYIEARNYTYTLLNILKSLRLVSTLNFVTTQFKDKYHKNNFKNVVGYSLKDALHEMITSYPSVRWNNIMSEMCPVWDQEMEEIELDQDRLDEINYIISNAELRELAILNYKLVFKNKDVPFSQLFDRTSKYTEFISRTSYLYREEGYEPNEVKYYSNLLGDYILERFKKSTRNKRKGDTVFAKIYSNLIDYADLDPNMPEDMAHDKVIEVIERTIGSMRNFEELIKECFTLKDYNNIKNCKELGIKI